MGIPGSYLVLNVEGGVVAEATDINMLIKATAIDAGSKDSGIYSEYEGGKVKIAMAGAFLYASDGNWSNLYGYMKEGNELGVSLYVNGSELLNGYGIIKKLSLRGSDESSLVTGAYGIVYNSGLISEQEVDAILTETGIEIQTETEETITTE